MTGLAGSSSTAFWAVLAVLASAFLYLAKSGRRDKSLPPGPPTTAFLGNAHLMPARNSHLYLTKLSREYGEIFSLKIFNSNLIVLNSSAAMSELLDKRNTSFNGRPPVHIHYNMTTKGHHVVLANGKKHTIFRKMFHRFLSTSVVHKHLALQEAEASAVLYNLLKNPGGYFKGDSVRVTPFIDTALAVVYGKRCPTYDDVDAHGFNGAEFYHLAHEHNSYLELGNAPPVDVFPILKHVPDAFAGWKRKVKDLARRQDDLYINRLYSTAKVHVNNGRFDADSCWMADIIINNPGGLSDECLAWNGGIALETAADTSASSFLVTCLVSVLYPDIVKKAQAELDQVVGSSRAPTKGDMDNLPYCRAFIREVLRFRPPVATGVPHLCTKDETYSGYVIPAGSTVIQNVWAVMHSPDYFENPDTFEPDRFLTNEHGLKQGADETGWRNTFMYGGGRRICIGMHLVENSLQCLVPKLLWAFKWEARGPIDVGAVAPGIVLSPLEFQCEVKPRSAQIEKVILSEYAGLQDFYSQYAP